MRPKADELDGYNEANVYGDGTVVRV